MFLHIFRNNDENLFVCNSTDSFHFTKLLKKSLLPSRLKESQVQAMNENTRMNHMPLRFVTLKKMVSFRAAD